MIFACGFFIFLGLWMVSDSMDRIAESIKEIRLTKPPNQEGETWTQ